LNTLEVNSLVVRYNHKMVLNNLSFFVPKNTFIAIVGNNGVGKTSLFKAIQNKIAYNGNIAINGKLSVLKQNNQITFPIEVAELVVMGNYSNKAFLENYNQSDYELAKKSMQKTGIESLYNADFQNLSGGEKQLVWLSQLLLQNADIYLLDEPTQSLDLKNKKKVFDVIKNEFINTGKTVLCITHDLYNLLEIDGYLLNLSEKEPSLKKISKEAIDEAIGILYQ
jgi:iron complex transport system ATP-binding protein